MYNISPEILVPIVIGFLLVRLVIFMKRWLQKLIANQIYDNFPFVKETIDTFELRCQSMKTKIADLETKLHQLQAHAAK